MLYNTKQIVNIQLTLQSAQHQKTIIKRKGKPDWKIKIPAGSSPAGI
jgi:hypothetical protein